MRVLHIVPALFGPTGVVGGAERYALELARYMSREVPTRLLTFGDKEIEQMDGGLRIRVAGHSWYVRGQRSNPFSGALFSELRWANVIHCHQQHVLASSLAALCSRLTGRKVFVTDLGGGGWDISAYLSTDRWYHGHLHISQYSRAAFGHDRRKWAHVILGGVDTEKFSPNDSILPNGASSVLFVGRLLPHKGVDFLIRAMPDHVPLDLIGPRIGEGELYYTELRALAARKQVTFHHDCTDAELISSYRHALCVVLPSLYRNLYGQTTKVPELLGQTLLEGMACGRPAICTAVASLPEIVEDGVSGFVVPPDDETTLRKRILWLRENPDQARTMGQAARQRVLEKFLWPAVVKRCLEIYAQA